MRFWCSFWSSANALPGMPSNTIRCFVNQIPILFQFFSRPLCCCCSWQVFSYGAHMSNEVYDNSRYAFYKWESKGLHCYKRWVNYSFFFFFLNKEHCLIHGLSTFLIHRFAVFPLIDVWLLMRSIEIIADRFMGNLMLLRDCRLLWKPSNAW